MRKRMIKVACLLLGVCQLAFAQDKDKKWDVNNPPGDFKEIEFTTDEGTWMSLDVSPDGKEVVFDMMGDIYSIPIKGGEANVLRQGHAFEVQPSYSPDGSQIMFTSDAGGGDNIWMMNRDGSEAKQITKENFRLLNNADWAPDGQYFVARKHFTSGRSLGAGELWMYHISGGSGVQLTQRKNDQQDVGEPCFSPDGRYIYYSEDMYPGGAFEYNKDPNSQIYVIKRYDRETGEIETITGGPGGAITPQISHNGKLMAFIKRVRTKSVLYLHDLTTGQEWPIYEDLSKDQQEAWAIFGPYTGYSWTPDDQHIVIWAKGKLRKINVDNGSAEMIPFEVNAKHKIYHALRFKQEVAPEKFTAKAIRHLATSPDGNTVVFNAVGYLWKKKLPNGKPQRLTNHQTFEYEPTFSKDGKTLAYVTWDDEELGAIYTLDLTAKKAQPVKVTREKGIYRAPDFSPEGKTLVFQKEVGNYDLGFDFSKKPGIYTMPAQGGEMTLVGKEGAYPQFDKEGKRIFYQTGGYFFGSLKKELKSVKVDGSDEKTHFIGDHANRFLASPDNQWVAFMELHKVYIAPMHLNGKPFELKAGTQAIPVSQVTKDAGINLHWSADSKKLHWTLGGEYFTTEVKKRFTFLEGSPDSVPPPDTTGVALGLEVELDKPEKKLVLSGAKIITMKGDEVIENGVIVINENRIEAIGKAGEVNVPANAKVVDVTGKTIMPGIVDVHAHLRGFRYGLSPKQHWAYYANLAYGVTTTHDPSANTEMVFSQSEMVKAGQMVGPRIFSTGTILYGADGDFKAVVNNLDDARSAISRTKAFGAFSVKSYNQPRREQRQQIITAAKEQGVMVVPEGGSTFFHNMSMILDGHTGIEHNIPIFPAYKDVQTVWSESQTGYTPTLIVNYGSITGEYYWYQTTNVWEKERLLNFTPRAVVDARSRHRTMVPMEEYENGHILSSQLCKELTDKGVKVNLGAHGQIQGIGAHWELWMLAQGGMSNLEAIRAATWNGAHYIGMDHEIGSLEAGKLADLIVLDKDPLENIRNTEFVRYTMINGRLFEAESMKEVGNVERKRSKFYWENGKFSQHFPWHFKTRSFMRPTCSCGIN
ncbi:amidohydrolase family protein [Rapidithrix thailandica]|uniref:Amidohydrolase family protein n=1 Tax=Rapidithrix thailandica TaxID=413964 RepID=A0AAW9RRJ9_9BACT